MTKLVLFLDSNDVETVFNRDQLSFAAYSRKGISETEGFVTLNFDKGRSIKVQAGAESDRVWDLIVYDADKNRPRARGQASGSKDEVLRSGRGGRLSAF